MCYLILLKYLYIFSLEKVHGRCAPKQTKLHNGQEIWGVCSNTSKYSVRSNTLTIIFIYKIIIFTICFLQNFTKILSKTHQIASFLKKFLEEHAPEPPPPSQQTRGFGAKHNANTPTFPKIF